MNKKPFLSLACKLIIVSAIIIVGISILFWYPSVLHLQKEELNKNVNFAESQVDVIKRALYYGMLTNQRDFIRQTVNSLATAEDILWLRLLDARGAVRFSSVKIGIDPGAVQSLEASNGKSSAIKDVHGHRALIIAEPILNSVSCYTASCHAHARDEKVLGRIELGFSLRSVDTYIRKQGFTVAAFGFVFIAVLSVPLYLIVHRFVLKPVSLLSEGIQRVAAGDLSHTIVLDSRDELGVLARSFNSMTRKLQERDDAIAKELDDYRASLLHAQKMEAIGNLSAGIAHDFNNILTGIMGYSELALDEMGEGGASREYIGRVMDLTQKATDFTRQILLIGRKLPPARRPVNINYLIEDSMRMLRRMVEENIEIKVSLQTDIPLVDADQAQITQVLMNLVVNARDALRKGGVIEIKTGETVVDEEYCRYYAYARPGDYVTLSVIDNGEGIPGEIRDRVFEPFFTTKTKGKGTGLGLAVTYSIVKAHGGWINLYSEVGRGSEFRVYLPASSESELVLQGVLEKEELPRGTENILLVDDDEVIRELGSSILEGLGYRVITASNGEEALKLYGEEGKDIALVIMDRVMPKMDGFEAYNRLKEMNPMVKVIISSGYSADEALSLKESGVLGFLDKPYRMAEMAKMVRKAIDA